MKYFRNIMWVFIAIALAGCDPAPQGAFAQANSSSDQKAVSWIADSQQSPVSDGVLTRKNFYVIIDGSGSMRDYVGGEMKIFAAKDAIKRFAQLVPADANLGLFAFDGKGITERVPLGLDNRKAFIRELENVDTDSNTPLKSAITGAYEKIRIQAGKQQGYGEYHLVIVTDGEANVGEDPTSIVNQILAESPVVIHTIGFGIGERHSLNQRGRTIYKSAGDKQGLSKGLSDVLAESEKFDK